MACLVSAGGGPKRLRVLLEGEALLNDASSFTLFEIFLHLVEQLNSANPSQESGWAVFWEIVKSALKLAGGEYFYALSGVCLKWRGEDAGGGGGGAQTWLKLVGIEGFWGEAFLVFGRCSHEEGGCMCVAGDNVGTVG